MDRMVGSRKSRVETFGCKVSNFDGMALARPGHACGNGLSDAQGKRATIGVGNNDKSVHGRYSC
jgi:hypothetical protein